MLIVTVHQYQIIPDYVKTHGADLVIPQLWAPNDCHCERSEAILSFKVLDCFVVSLLAMTGTHAFPPCNRTAT